MGRFPVYQPPHLDEVEQRMRSQSGPHGYLEGDPRPLVVVLNEDEKVVKAAGLTHQKIAERLSRLTEAAEHALGDPVLVDGRFRVKVESARGKIPCPWAHPGLYPKTHVLLERTDTGETLRWSHLAVHMIEAHGFYQGRRSPYRLDPRKLIEILDLAPDEEPPAPLPPT